MTLISFAHPPPDLAVQAHVLRGAGLTIRRTELMHHNRDCRHPDLSNLFARQDLTPEVDVLVGDTLRDLRVQQRMLRGPLPEVPVGDGQELSGLIVVENRLGELEGAAANRV